MRPLAILACLALCPGGVVAQLIFFDDFESYSHPNQMTEPGAWGDVQDFGQPPAGFLTLGGNPDKCMGHDGGETNRHSIAPVYASDAHPIVWEFDLIDLNVSALMRVTGGLRVGASTAILEMGHYNVCDWPENGGNNVGGYAVRTVFVGGPTVDGGWICFPLHNLHPPREGTHHFRATIGSNGVLFELDLDDDGTVDDTRVVFTGDLTGLGWDTLRIGGPSDLTSSAGNVNFDNVSISGGRRPACPADIDDNGTLNLDDIDAFTHGFLTMNPNVADLTGEGAINIDDVDTFVASFLAGCP